MIHQYFCEEEVGEERCEKHALVSEKHIILIDYTYYTGVAPEIGTGTYIKIEPLGEAPHNVFMKNQHDAGMQLVKEGYEFQGSLEKLVKGSLTGTLFEYYEPKQHEIR